MGAWYDYLEELPKPDWIMIKSSIDPKSGTKKIEAILQYKGQNEILDIDEFSFNLHSLQVIIEKGEKWGDWGGLPIKIGDILLIRAKRLKTKWDKKKKDEEDD